MAVAAVIADIVRDGVPHDGYRRMPPSSGLPNGIAPFEADAPRVSPGTSDASTTTWWCEDSKESRGFAPG